MRRGARWRSGISPPSLLSSLSLSLRSFLSLCPSRERRSPRERRSHLCSLCSVSLSSSLLSSLSVHPSRLSSLSALSLSVSPRFSLLSSFSLRSLYPRGYSGILCPSRRSLLCPLLSISVSSLSLSLLCHSSLSPFSLLSQSVSSLSSLLSSLSLPPLSAPRPRPVSRRRSLKPTTDRRRREARGQKKREGEDGGGTDRPTNEPTPSRAPGARENHKETPNYGPPPGNNKKTNPPSLTARAAALGHGEPPALAFVRRRRRVRLR